MVGIKLGLQSIWWISNWCGKFHNGDQVHSKIPIWLSPGAHVNQGIGARPGVKELTEISCGFMVFVWVEGIMSRYN